MYSRKFSGVSCNIPHGYSGVAVKENYEPDNDTRSNSCISEDDCRASVKYDKEESQQCNSGVSGQCNSRNKEKKGILPSLGNFSLEDIILAGIILMLLDEDQKDTGTIIILALLLIMGL